MFYRYLVQTEITLNSFKWADYTNPDREVLSQIAAELGLENKVLFNCLDSDYLPHIENYTRAQFLILRMMEPESLSDADSVQELTTKIAIFMSRDKEKLVTIHRLPLPEISAVKAKIGEMGPEKITRSKFIGLFYEEVSLGFDKPLTELETKLHYFEENLFSSKKSRRFLQEGFYLKRKASAFKKVLRLTLDLQGKLNAQEDFLIDHFQQSKDRLERSLFYAEDVFDNVQSLLNLHVAIEAQKTNDASFRTTEIMRVLTVLTIFFLPLNFIAGVFGMNFANLPLLANPEGFGISIIIMLLISIALWLYLTKLGWLGSAKVRAEAIILEKKNVRSKK